MEDRIEFNGNIFKVITSESSGVITSDIVKVSKNNKEEIMYRFNIPTGQLSKIHTKVISILFKAIQKYKEPSKDVFKEFDDFQEQKSYIRANNNEKFETVCKSMKQSSMYACYLLKENSLYSYIHKENQIDKDKIESYINSFLSIFDRENKNIKNIKKIFTNWRQIIESFDSYHIYYIKLDNGILITILKSSLNIGQVINITNSTVDYLKDKKII